MRRPAFLYRWAQDRQGSALVEFALVAPLAIAMLFGVIEGARLYWTRQTLTEIAYVTARCMSVSASCATEQARRDYAVARARRLAVAIAASEVATATGTTCSGEGGSNRVVITHPYNSPLADMVPLVPARIAVTACFPVLS